MDMPDGITFLEYYIRISQAISFGYFNAAYGLITINFNLMNKNDGFFVFAELILEKNTFGVFPSYMKKNTFGVFPSYMILSILPHPMEILTNTDLN